MTIKAVASIVTFFAATAAAPATAQAAPDASAAPAAAPEAALICTDRPTKANVVCTVPAGAFQVEADIVNWARTGAPGARTDVVLYTNPTFKYGLGATTDVELNIAPYETVRTRSGGGVDRQGGVGDLYLRLKQQLTSPTAKTQVTLIPYVKAPTARVGLGNGLVEGGVIAPIAFSLPKDVDLTLGPEIDILANSNRRGRHVQLVGLVNVSKGVGDMTLYAELWTGQNRDPAGTIRQYSADAAVTYLLTRTLLIDAGANVGLNRETPDLQLYLGISKRF